MTLPLSSDRTIHRVVRRVWLRSHLLLVGSAALAAIFVMSLLHFLMSFIGTLGWGWVFGGGVLAAVAVIVRGSRVQPHPAHRIDEALDLKDRVASAEEFSRSPDRTDIHRLQIRDAASRVNDVSVARVVPWAWRRDLALAALATFFFLAGQWPRGPEDVQAMVSSAPPALAQEADRLQEQLEALTEEIADAENESLQQTLEELTRQAAELDEPGKDMDAGLQDLGRIRNELEEAVSELDLATEEALLAAMAEALQLAAPTRSAARSLARGDFAEAAAALESAAEEAADPDSPFSDLAQAMANPMEQLARRATEAGNRRLSEGFQQMTDAIRSGDPQACSEALQRQAMATRQAAARQSLANALEGQLQRLGDARDRMTQSYCASCMNGEGACVGEQGGACASGGLSLAAQNDPTSVSPSDAAGMGTHDAPFGELTELESARIQEMVSGQPGSGPSEFSLELAPHANQQASREYRAAYAAYRKLSEQALEQEPVPPTHEDVIRTYFESIRPQD